VSAMYKNQKSLVYLGIIAALLIASGNNVGGDKSCSGLYRKKDKKLLRRNKSL